MQTSTTIGLSSSLPYSSYVALLPTLWALRAEQDVVSTVLQHATSGSGVGNKAVKRAATEFVGRIVLVSSYNSVDSTYPDKNIAGLRSSMY